ncbi:hypothetical protein [Actinoalloteichus spitiensis]|uniref:hypothetical protein n=1 Tax=Actinoalloteichus spitiensis TaxID=252394 RepID=UPI00035E3E69|nr:hypothetical protein [Actinoalloteichus spitiensis]
MRTERAARSLEIAPPNELELVADLEEVQEKPEGTPPLYREPSDLLLAVVLSTGEPPEPKRPRR